MIYADNAATTKVDIDVFEAMKPYFMVSYCNASEPYKFAREGKKALKKARETIANCINAEPEEIYFTSCGTESDNWAIKGIALANKLQGKIITSVIEHHAVLHACKAMEQLGLQVEYLPVDKKGVVSLSSLRNAIDDKTKLVSIMTANNEIGSIQEIKQLADIAHSKGTLFHTDAVQAIGHIPLDVKYLGVDMLSASGHKFNAPKGIGFMYIKKGTNIIPFMHGGAQEYKLRAGTENVAFAIGMAKALELNCHRMHQTEQHLLNLESIILNKLDTANIDYIRNGAVKRTPGNISLSFKGFEGEALLHRLDLKGICVSTGSACDSQNTQISHVLKAIGLEEGYALGTIRISLGRYNTFDEADYIGDTLVNIIKNRK